MLLRALVKCLMEKPEMVQQTGQQHAWSTTSTKPMVLQSFRGSTRDERQMKQCPTYSRQSGLGCPMAHAAYSWNVVLRRRSQDGLSLPHNIQAPYTVRPKSMLECGIELFKRWSVNSGTWVSYLALPAGRSAITSRNNFCFGSQLHPWPSSLFSSICYTEIKAWGMYTGNTWWKLLAFGFQVL